MFKKLNNKKGVAHVAWFLLFPLITIGVGHYEYSRGKFGKDGEKAVKNCLFTHVDGNCAHMKISDL